MKWLERVALVGILGFFAGLLLGAITTGAPLWLKIMWGSATVAAVAAVLIVLHVLGREEKP